MPARLLYAHPCDARSRPSWRVHAAVWAYLAAAGTLIGAHDLWIAATAVTHGLDLATGDATSFRRVPGLTVYAPS